MTVANLFCGYACVVYATRADFETAARQVRALMFVERFADEVDERLAALEAS